MSRLTTRNLVATLIIVVGIAASALGWSYVPLVVLPLIPLLACLGAAVFLTLYPASTDPVRTAVGRPPAAVRLAGGGAAAAARPGPGRRVPARQAPPRPAARGATWRRSDGQAARLPPDGVVDLAEE